MSGAPKQIWAVYDPGDIHDSTMPTLLAYEEAKEAVAPAICYDTEAVAYHHDDTVQALVQAARDMIDAMDAAGLAAIESVGVADAIGAMETPEISLRAALAPFTEGGE